MTTDSYLLAATMLAVVGIVVLMGLGVCVGFLSGRQAGGSDAAKESRMEGREISERLLRELKHCLDMADCVVRDADALSATTHQPGAQSRDAEIAVAQLRKTVKGLAARLEQICDEKPVISADYIPRPAAMRPDRITLPIEEQLSSTAGFVPSDLGAAAAHPDDQRKFQRKAFPGSLKATIYPPPFQSGGGPLQCTVITRDLSCGGIGIAHTEQLYPRQIIVLHAVSKLLIAEVRWCQQIGERSFIAGCQFVKATG